MMWRDVAEMASKHLRRNDFIFASGNLVSNEKEDGSGKIRVLYKVSILFWYILFMPN